MKNVKSNKAMVFAMAAMLVLGMGISPVYADGHCPLKGKCDKEMTFEKKFYKKVKFMHKYEDELGLTDAQKSSLKELKTNLKKSLIEQDARADVIKVDIKSEMYERTINVDAVNALVDQKYEVKKVRSKSLVKAFADLKSIVTDEQYETMKKLWKEKKDKYEHKKEWKKDKKSND